MAHTPGPWTFDGDYVEALNGDAPLSVATIADCGSSTQSNGLLIAAAPELLAACKTLRDCLSDWVEVADKDANVSEDIQALDCAIAAIAKAEGMAE